MYYKSFQDISISALGMGGLRFPCMPGNPNKIDRVKGQMLIDAAIAAGINYFDTAYTYQNGDSERFLGEALRKYDRSSYFLASKFYAAASSDIDSVFKEQLARLNTEYFDFYLLHSLDENYIDEYMDEKKDYLGYLIQQKKAGRIHYLGFSSHASPEVLERFLNWYDDFDMAIIQLNYIDWTVLDAKRQYELLTQRNIPVWVMEPLKGGRLVSLNAEAENILKEAAPERSIPSWGLRYLMGLPNVQVVLSGMSDLVQLAENAATFDHPDPLDYAEREALQKAKDVFLKDLGVPCSACRYCCATCPAGLDIPLLIKGYNEKRVSGEIWRVAEFSHTKGAENCIQCGVCRKHCPQKIDIPAIMYSLSHNC